MLDACADPKSLEGLSWLLCYLTSGKHVDFYWSFVTVLALLVVTAPVALLFGFGGASAARSHILPLRLLGKGYTAGVGMSIGTAFGRIAGRNAALAAAGKPAVHGAVKDEV